MPKKSSMGDNFASKTVVFTMEAPEGEVGEKFTFDLSKVSPDNVIRLALHGASQKIGDSYAGAKDSGEDPVAYAKAAIADTIKQLPLRDGFDEILLPGERGGRTETSRRASGIPIPAGTWKALEQVAETYAIELPKIEG